MTWHIMSRHAHEKEKLPLSSSEYSILCNKAFGSVLSLEKAMYIAMMSISQFSLPLLLLPISIPVISFLIFSHALKLQGQDQQVGNLYNTSGPSSSLMTSRTLREVWSTCTLGKGQGGNRNTPPTTGVEEKDKE